MTLAAPPEEHEHERADTLATSTGRSSESLPADQKVRRTAVPVLTCVGVLALANSSWLLTPSGFIDPWVYLNYFRRIAGDERWDNYYKVSRVSWNALGYVTVSLFGLDATQLVLALGSIVALVLISAALLRPLATEAIVVALVLVALYPVMHGPGGWLYQNALSGPLQVAAMLIGLRLALAPEWPGKTRVRLACWFGFGFLVAMLAVTNTMQVLAVSPVIALIAITAARRRPSWQHAARSLSAAAVGAIGAFLLCATVSALAGGRFLFYLPLYRTFSSFASKGGDQAWWHPLSTGWWRDATYLVVPIGAGIVGVVQLVTWVRTRRENPHRAASAADSLALALIVCHLVVLTGWIVSYAFKYHLLNWGHHSYPIMLSSALALGGSVQLAISRRDTAGATDGARATSRWFPWVAAAVPTALLLFPVVAVNVDLTAGDTKLRGGFLGGLLLFAAAATACYLAKSRRGLAIVLVVLLGLLITTTGARREYSLARPCEQRRLGNTTVIDTAELYPRSDPTVRLYARPGERVLAGDCAFALDDIAASLSVVSPFRQSGRDSEPGALQARPTDEGRQLVALLRSTRTGRAWERDAIAALTGDRPDRVVARSVRPVGDPGGEVEVVRLVIA